MSCIYCVVLLRHVYNVSCVNFFAYVLCILRRVYTYEYERAKGEYEHAMENKMKERPERDNEETRRGEIQEGETGEEKEYGRGKMERENGREREKGGRI